MRRPVIIASILALLTACDKPQQPAPNDTPSVPLTEISASSSIFFQVYGAREEPRIVPFAIVENGALRPITLDAGGWESLDSAFFPVGGRLSLYRDGVANGDIEIVRGMWSSSDGALYSLPGCRLVVPQAQGKLGPRVTAEASIEFLASTTPLKQKTDARAMPKDAITPGRTIANAVASAAEVGPEEVSHLEFIGRWLRTGAGPEGRTLLATFIDPEAGDAGPGAGHTVSLLALAEDAGGAFATSYQHVSQGEARSVEFRRLVNHADLDGDGIDEILLEAWRYAATPEVVVLKYAGGKWTESFRVSENWCLDTKKGDKD